MESLYEWTEMIEEIRGIFGRDIDLVEKSGLRNPFRRHEILNHREILSAAEKADAAYLWDMLDAARAISEFVAGRNYTIT